MPVQRLSHIGVCVTDLERSRAFYRDVLDFEELHDFQTEGEQSAQLLGIEGGKVQAVYLQRDGTRIELLHYPGAAIETLNAPRPMNRVGLSHLSLRVADIDAVIARAKSCGGNCLEETRVNNEAWRTRAVFITDPDGLRIELLEAPGDPASLPGG